MATVLDQVQRVRKPKVFISYTGRDAEGRDTSKALFEKLEAAGFEPFRDRERLNEAHGDRWHKMLDDELSRCHASIVVLSPKSVESDWARHEASILSHRRRVQTGFELRPVRVGGVEESFLKENGLPWLAEFQSRPVVETDFDDVVGTLDGLKKVFGTLDVDHAAIDIISGVLARSETATLSQLAAEMKLDLGVWTGETELRVLFARCIASALVRVNPLVKVVARLKKVMRSIDRVATERIAHIIAPFWIDKDLAAGLCATRDREHRLAWMDSSDEFAGRMCTHRASGDHPAWCFVPIIGRSGADSDEQIIQELDDEIRRSILDSGVVKNAASVDGLIVGAPETLVVFIPNRVPDRIVEGLRERLEGVTFIVGDPALDPDEADDLYDDVARLEFGQSTDDLRALAEEYATAMDFLESSLDEVFGPRPAGAN